MIKKLAAVVGIVVFFVLAGTAAGYAYWTASVSATGSVQVADVAATNCTNPVTIANGDFENPAIANNSWSELASTGVPGWTAVRPGTQTATTTEMWRGSVVTPILPVSGAQNLEVNGTEAATVYQNVTTTPGQVLQWGFWHRGRDSGTNPDKVQLTIGAPTASGAAVMAGATSNTNPTTLASGNTLVMVFPTTNSAWKYYSGSYTVPTGQTTTRMSFTSHTQGGGNASQGNLIDGVTFGTGPCLTMTSAIARVTGGPGIEPGTLVRVTTTVANAGGRSANGTVLTLPLPTTVGSVTNVRIDGAAAGTQATQTAGVLTLRIGAGAGAAAGGTVAGGGTVTVTYDATVTGLLGQTIATTPSVAYGDTATPGIVLTRTGASVSVTIVDTTPPVAAGTPVLTPTGTTSIQLSWAASTSSDVHHYEVQRVSSTGTWATVNANVVGTTWTDTGLTAGQAYAYRIVAKDASGNASTSDVAAGLTHLGTGQYRIAWMNGTTPVCVDSDSSQLRNAASCGTSTAQRWTFSATSGATRVVSVSNTNQLWMQNYSCTFGCSASANVTVATPDGNDYVNWAPEAYWDGTNAFVRFRNTSSNGYLGVTNANNNTQLSVSSTVRNFVLTQVA